MAVPASSYIPETELNERRLPLAAAEAVADLAHDLVVENVLLALAEAHLEVLLAVPRLPRVLPLPLGLALGLLLLLLCQILMHLARRGGKGWWQGVVARGGGKG
eukprot:scaffold20068_cov48-Phaeocystis_antarctica.AAC.1